MTSAEIRAWLVAEIARITGMEASAIDVRAPFDSHGLASLDAVGLSGELEHLLGRDLSSTLVYEHPSIEALAHFLGDPGPVQGADPPDGRPSRPPAPIAIVGIGCRFPGAEDPAAFWRLLRDGKDMIREVPADRWDAAAFYDQDSGIPGKASTRWGGFLDQVDHFDPFFFGISPGEAERMDPQQRLLMELAYEAFEDAGCSIPDLAGSQTAVLVGISVNEYSLLQHGQHELLNGHSGTGAALSIAANRISYYFDLHGPSLAVDTACSSSLMAVHLACQSLRTGECDLALAGGVNLMFSPAHSVAFSKAGVLAADGRCKPFDASADGYVRGEGGGLVVLKPLDRAVADGNQIYAVIRGSAVMQDGRTNGLMAPNGLAQEAVLRAAYADAGVFPGRVQYVETHGTGTLLGDSMEARALGAVLSVGRPNGACRLGSVKSNLGHLEAAAGAAGLIKVALALRYRVLPPSLHFKTPNPHVPFESLGLQVQDQRSPWPDHNGPAIAGVSSFGFGGTNVHLVVEEAPPAGPALPDTAELMVLPLSAHSGEALVARARGVRDAIAAWEPDADVTLADICAGGARRGTHLDHRLAVVARSKQELVERLDTFVRGDDHPEVMLGGAPNPSTPRLAFVFSGQGSQWPRMGRELFHQEPVFRTALERCDAVLRPMLGWSPLERILADDVEEGGEGIEVVQPLLFSIQVALAALWRSWGIEPDAVVGHSMGEVAAAHVAGALRLADAARLIVLRSGLLSRLTGQGGMAVVGLSAEETTARLGSEHGGLGIAASNGPRTTVVAGAGRALDAFLERLTSEGIFCRRVQVDVAAHGVQAAPLAGELRLLLSMLEPQAGSTTFVSSVTGTIADSRELGAEYWARNLTAPVNFFGAVQELLRAGDCDFIEISPHPVLQGAVQQSLLHDGRNGVVLASVRREEGEQWTLLHSLAALYLSGRAIEWGRLYPSVGRFATLPPYPWQRQRFWLGTSTGVGQSPEGRKHPRAPGIHPFLGRQIPLARDPKTHLWESELDPRDEAWLGDHRVNGDLVVPGSALLEMALSAAAQAGCAQSHVLTNVVFARGIVLPPGASSAVQTVLVPAEDGCLSFEVFGQVEGPDRPEWALHATAEFVPTPVLRDDSGDNHAYLAGVQARCSARVTPADLYRSLAARGLEYGPVMQGLREVWQGSGEALGRLALPGPLRAGAGRYRIHPALLDAALQTIAAVPALTAVGEPDTTFVPVGCRSVWLIDSPDGAVWSHVTLQSGSEDADELEADVTLLDASGRQVGQLLGFRLARMRLAPRVDAPQGDQDTWLYRLKWHEARWPDAAPQPAGPSNRWLIFAGAGGVADELAIRLNERGQSCQVIRLDTEPTVGSNRQVEGVSPDQAVESVVKESFGNERSTLRGVVWLWGSDLASPPKSPELPGADAQQACNAVLSLVRRLVAATGAISIPRLWLVTRGAQAALTGDQVAVAQAPLWGLGKSIAFELPQFQCTLVDLNSDVDAASASERLAKELLAADAEDQVALRGDRRLVARLRSYRPPPASASCPEHSAEAFRADGCYLITGGLGGLGLTVAQWMVERGARHLVLVGRRLPSPAAVVALGLMRGAGATVDTIPVDVSRASQVDGLIAQIRERMPPLRGVLHAAGVLENSPIVALDAGRLSRVMAPKVEGAWNLHLATGDDPLDFFVLFSSAVSVLGSPGQGNYSAANSFLDGLAHLRRAEGRPALSINWGPWADVGLVADGNFIGGQAGTGDRGVKGILPRRGLEVLGNALSTGETQLTVLPFDLKSLLDLYPQAARIPLFTEVGGRESHVAGLYARPRLRQAYIAPRTDMEQRLAEMWRQTLRIDRVGVRDSFFELGGDSVLAAQLVTSAHRAFGVELDLRETFKAFTIESLAARVEAALIARVDSLSESEVHQLLEER